MNKSQDLLRSVFAIEAAIPGLVKRVDEQHVVLELLREQRVTDHAAVTLLSPQQTGMHKRYKREMDSLDANVAELDAHLSGRLDALEEKLAEEKKAELAEEAKSKNFWIQAALMVAEKLIFPAALLAMGWLAAKFM